MAVCAEAARTQAIRMQSRKKTLNGRRSFILDPSQSRGPADNGLALQGCLFVIQPLRRASGNLKVAVGFNPQGGRKIFPRWLVRLRAEPHGPELLRLPPFQGNRSFEKASPHFLRQGVGKNPLLISPLFASQGGEREPTA